MFGFTLPELPTSESVQDFWEMVGRCGMGQGGPLPLTWLELQAFGAMSGMELSAPEARCIVEMSRAYCNELANSNPLRISPMERQA